MEHIVSYPIAIYIIINQILSCGHRILERNEIIFLGICLISSKNSAAVRVVSMANGAEEEEKEYGAVFMAIIPSLVPRH